MGWAFRIRKALKSSVNPKESVKHLAGPPSLPRVGARKLALHHDPGPFRKNAQGVPALIIPDPCSNSGGPFFKGTCIIVYIISYILYLIYYIVYIYNTGGRRTLKSPWAAKDRGGGNVRCTYAGLAAAKTAFRVRRLRFRIPSQNV